MFIALCTDNPYGFGKERWLFGEVDDHVGIYGSMAAQGLSTFNIGLVVIS